MSYMDDRSFEKAIQARGLTAPRITPDDIEEVIVKEQYYVFPGTTLTICALTLANGFVVAGESASTSPENFDEGIGRHVSRAKARDKIWDLEGYRLKQQLSQVEARPIKDNPQA